MVRRYRTAVRSLVLIAMTAGVARMMAQEIASSNDPLSYRFTGQRGQVEVGGPYVGMEFHHSRPLPSRISFYYPVANSIDLSTDYWKRGDSRPMAIGIQDGDGPRHWIGRDSWSYIVSPHKALFTANEINFAYSIKYEFCLRDPAMVMTISVRN